MCGFAGLYLFQQFASAQELGERLASMAATIVHRGPDAESAIVDSFAWVQVRLRLRPSFSLRPSLFPRSLVRSLAPIPRSRSRALSLWPSA